VKRKGPVTRLKEECKEKTDEISVMKDKYMRAVADMHNYRKFMDKKMTDFKRSTKYEFFEKVIPVLDSFDRALSGVETESNSEHFYKGVEIIYRQLREALKSLGLVEFSGIGEVFDPSRHEAVAMVPTDSQPENMVIEEVHKGYMVDGRVVKPAKVFVSKQKEGGQEDGKNNRD
jgi:molecular chaperone GrpE